MVRNAVSAQATVGDPMPSVGSSSRMAALRAKRTGSLVKGLLTKDSVPVSASLPPGM